MRAVFQLQMQSCFCRFPVADRTAQSRIFGPVNYFAGSICVLTGEGAA